jgi:hypothetical protein
MHLCSTYHIGIFADSSFKEVVTHKPDSTLWYDLDNIGAVTSPKPFPAL